MFTANFHNLSQIEILAACSTSTGDPCSETQGSLFQAAVSAMKRVLTWLLTPGNPDLRLASWQQGAMFDGG
ncbi:MAG TPA: hypothetical protein PKE31_04915 [Pseudomonadota bacterium]|nr:hypothetical protein [Pseudomonadota bacterium]